MRSRPLTILGLALLAVLGWFAGPRIHRALAQRPSGPVYQTNREVEVFGKPGVPPPKKVEHAPRKVTNGPVWENLDVPDFKPNMGQTEIGVTGYASTPAGDVLPIGRDRAVTLGVQRGIVVPNYASGPRDLNRVRVEVYAGAITCCGGDPPLVAEWNSEPFELGPGTRIVDNTIRPRFRLPAGVYTFRVDLQEFVGRGEIITDEVTGVDLALPAEPDWHLALRKTQKFIVR